MQPLHTGLPCIIRDAPSQVGGVRDLLIERLKNVLLEENYTLRDDPEEGPAIVFVVYYSRLEADLERDLKNGEQFHHRNLSRVTHLKFALPQFHKGARRFWLCSSPQTTLTTDQRR